MASQQEVIKKFMASLDTTTKRGETALNEAIKSCSTFNSMQDAIDQMIADCKTAKSADDFLKTYCGINLDNDDTGAITGSDAGGDTTKTAESIVTEEGSLIELTSRNWFNDIEGQDGLIVQLAKRTGSLKESMGNIAVRDFNELSEQEIYLWRAIYTWWVRNGLNLIAESYGDNFSFDEKKSSATNKDRTLYIIFEKFDADDNALADTWGDSTNDQNLVIRINLNYYGDADGVDGKSEDTSEYLDRTLAHELTHAVMRANINYHDDLPAFVKEGVAELTHGIDDFRTDSIKKIGGRLFSLG
ncbi:MAG: hypothetical protein II857_10805 [Selenomonadaceae bacterium]|nr:hypothetical protein [Selenomonadaceae bacterium]